MKLKNAELLAKKFRRSNNEMLRSKSKPILMGPETKYDQSMRQKRKIMGELKSKLEEKDKIKIKYQSNKTS